ncbi:VOC family protein [Deinococcus yavapaiensis]|uniref:Catechol 2,3-dioxygenase-like lactoylglutathione lyase family enzyme n=1 Tax=Deinococcus yavapaiensis KR-236 TaxID=694435 RepID=A0A318S4S4_9DEIO|nr:VOC family protein [Deinococcus yavapaiensis]PYE52693.1 catechol 2,3-dioxygenase-like lactoylglutathione lyase family enzyme [Deinococcus yavapaiensis KR-236]
MTVPPDRFDVPVMLLELIPIPVTDVDRAKSFYADRVGFHVDHDVQPAPGRRVVQLTPPGSACSILLSAGLGEISSVTPGTLRSLHLVVSSVEQTRALLIENGVEVGSVQVFDRGVKFASFRDPDGNSWLLQEMPWRTL